MHAKELVHASKWIACNHAQHQIDCSHDTTLPLKKDEFFVFAVKDMYVGEFIEIQCKLIHKTVFYKRPKTQHTEKS